MIRELSIEAAWGLKPSSSSISSATTAVDEEAAEWEEALVIGAWLSRRVMRVDA